MNLTLDRIPRGEALSCLGYRGGRPVPPELDEAVAQASETLLQTAAPRVVWRVFSLGPGLCLDGGPSLPGNDLAVLLKDCGRAVLFAATLGAEVERLLSTAEVRNLGQALVLDACANAAIERVCDSFCEDLSRQYPDAFLTDRFSPGYGDCPLDFQSAFCALLDTQRRIGLTVTHTNLLLPRKSVTAVVGLADSPQPARFRGCAACNLFETCAFRKENRTCGKSDDS